MNLDKNRIIKYLYRGNCKKAAAFVKSAAVVFVRFRDGVKTGQAARLSLTLHSRVTNVLSLRGVCGGQVCDKANKRRGNLVEIITI